MKTTPRPHFDCRLCAVRPFQCERAIRPTGGGFRSTHKDFQCPNQWCDRSTLTPPCSGQAAAGANPTWDKQCFVCDSGCSGGCVAEGPTRCNACHRYEDMVAGAYGKEESTCVHACPEGVKYDATMCVDYGRYASGTSVLVKDVASGSFDVGGDCPSQGVISSAYHVSHGDCAQRCHVNSGCWGYSWTTMPQGAALWGLRPHFPFWGAIFVHFTFSHQAWLPAHTTWSPSGVHGTVCGRLAPLFSK